MGRKQGGGGKGGRGESVQAQKRPLAGIRLYVERPPLLGNNMLFCLLDGVRTKMARNSEIVVSVGRSARGATATAGGERIRTHTRQASMLRSKTGFLLGSSKERQASPGSCASVNGTVPCPDGVAARAFPVNRRTKRMHDSDPSPSNAVAVLHQRHKNRERTESVAILSTAEQKL
jgi:hypothetical protein